jgi:NADH-quinone oxidoreductase subunit A
MSLSPVLAAFSTPVDAWLPVVVLIVVAIGFAVVNIAASIILGPSRTGPGKETAYESGMIPVGDAHRRFNVRFYIVAMIFLVFDVEIIFFYPWAVIFAKHVRDASRKTGLVLLAEMGVFVVILLVAYVYAWGKGVFRWD